MPHPVLGLPNSKFRAAQLGNRKIASSSGAGVDAGGPQTFIPTVPSGYVALIDTIFIFFNQVAAASNATLTMNLNGGTLKFVSRADAATNKGGDYTLRPNGSLVVLGTSLTMQASANFNWFVQVEYRLSTVIDAIRSGYLPGTPFCASAVTGAPTDLITSATVTNKRGLDVRGLCITGSQQTAAAGTAREVLVGFWDGTTERKLAKTCYTSIGTVNGHAPMLISNGRFRGPLGAIPGTDPSFGIRATMADANAAVSIWGFFYPIDQGQRTWPGTGVIPGAADAFTGGDYFWLYTENTAAASYELFPATTVAQRQYSYVVDGMAVSLAANINQDSSVGLAFTDLTLKPCSGQVIINTAGAGNAGSVTSVHENMNLPLRIDGRVGVGVGVVAAPVSKLGVTVWGRFGGPALVGSNIAGFGYRSDIYTTGT